MLLTHLLLSLFHLLDSVLLNLRVQMVFLVRVDDMGHQRTVLRQEQAGHMH